MEEKLPLSEHTQNYLSFFGKVDTETYQALDDYIYRRLRLRQREKELSQFLRNNPQIQAHSETQQEILYNNESEPIPGKWLGDHSQLSHDLRIVYRSLSIVCHEENFAKYLLRMSKLVFGYYDILKFCAKYEKGGNYEKDGNQVTKIQKGIRAIQRSLNKMNKLSLDDEKDHDLINENIIIRDALNSFLVENNL